MFYFAVPVPNVSVTALNQSIGNQLSLKCDVSTVKGITSSVDIVWMANDVEMERYNGNITEDKTSYVYYYNANTLLTVNENNTVYKCQVVVNTNPSMNSSDSFTFSIGEYKARTTKFI